MVSDDWVIEMERATLTEYVPGQEGTPEEERYFVTVARFNLAGRAGYNAALLQGDGTVALAALQAGVTNFRLPGRTKDGQPIVLRYSTPASNTAVYQALPDRIGNWMLNLVGEINGLWRSLSDEQARAAAEELAAEREELAELEETAGEETEEGDPLGLCDGSPESASEAAGATPDGCTRSRRR